MVLLMLVNKYKYSYHYHYNYHYYIVYTWVNGSDARWLAKKEKWLKIHLEKIMVTTLKKQNSSNYLKKHLLNY